MAPKTIYTATSPSSIALVNTSVWTFLLGSDDYPSDTAFIDAETGSSISRLELKNATLALAHGFLHQLGSLKGPNLVPGSTVLIFSPNTIHFPIMLFGALAAGLKCCLTNSAYTPQELLYQFQDCKADAILVHPGHVQVVLEMLRLEGSGRSKSMIVLATLDQDPEYITLHDLSMNGRLNEEIKFDGARATETALICYSSGTTGLPKGVEVTFPAATIFAAIPLNVNVLAGATQLLHFPLLLAVPTIIMSKVDLDLFCRAVEKYKITMVYSAAAPLGGALAAAAEQKLQSVGARVVIGQGFGLTETSSTTHAVLPQDALAKAGSVGLLLPNLEARLVNEPDSDEPQLQEEEDGWDAAPGSPGELWLRGPTIMKGYLNNPRATQASITPDGWFRTGDVMQRDQDGYWFVVDRKKELIKYKGFQGLDNSIVPPAELEALLLTHPGVVDAAVIGIYSAKEGTELPRAYLVPRIKPASITEERDFCEGIQDWVASRVARHKHLRGGVSVVAAVPRRFCAKILEPPQGKRWRRGSIDPRLLFRICDDKIIIYVHASLVPVIVNDNVKLKTRKNQTRDSMMEISSSALPVPPPSRRVRRVFTAPSDAAAPAIDV
ncbi:AMP binding protein [Mycena latifolia]|nr:AMP binding protein [Mycena latifolia]